MDRTSSYGLWRYASEYLEAADLVAPKDSSLNLLFPAYQLLGQAIELVLKGFLRAKGASLTHLKHAMGHDLICALDEAESNDLPEYAPTSDAYQRFAEVVVMLAPYYRNHDFRYIQAGYKPSLPDIKQAIPAVKAIVDATKQFCFEERKHHQTAA